MPKTNVEYWQTKIARNVERDSDQLYALTAAGWRGLTLWECELADVDALARRLSAFLDENFHPQFLG